MAEEPQGRGFFERMAEKAKAWGEEAQVQQRRRVLSDTHQKLVAAELALSAVVADSRNKGKLRSAEKAVQDFTTFVNRRRAFLQEIDAEVCDEISDLLIGTLKRVHVGRGPGGKAVWAEALQALNRNVPYQRQRLEVLMQGVPATGAGAEESHGV